LKNTYSWFDIQHKKYKITQLNRKK